MKQSVGRLNLLRYSINLGSAVAHLSQIAFGSPRALFYTHSFFISSLVLLPLFLVGRVAAFGFGTLILPRSQTVNAARELVCWQREINRPHGCTDYWSLSLAGEYDRAFNTGRLADYLLGGPILSVEGSAYGPCQSICGTTVLADYVGLPRDFKSRVRSTPSMAQFIMDFDFYYGMDSLCPGLYARLHMPLVYANWDLNLCEAISVCGTATFPAGYMAATDVARNDLPCSFKQAMRGNTTFGDMNQPLAYGKIFDRQTIVHVSDLQAVIGYNFVVNSAYHAGFNARVSAPTGTVGCQEFLFEPVIGNGHHWEVGVGFTGHYDLFSDESCGSLIGVYLDCNATHLCATKTKRSYNFTNNGPGSRYMLLEDIRPASAGLFFSDGVVSEYQYTGILVNAINHTTLCSKINIPVQVDAVVKFAWSWHDLTVDVGYNLWFRSKEHLLCRAQFPENQYAFKGDAQVYGFTTPASLPIALGATQHAATLCGGQDGGNGAFTNANADNPVGAFSTGIVALTNLTAADALLLGVPQSAVATSRPSLLLSDADIADYSALVPAALSQKVFLHVNYTWNNKHSTTPYLGLGADIEYAHGPLCTNSAVTTWGIWITGGFSR